MVRFFFIHQFCAENKIFLSFFLFFIHTDYHALLIFSSKQKAQEAMKLSYANIRLRKLSQATAESKSKAVSLAPLPYKKRPETSAVLARRLVSGALGLKVNISPEQRAAESKKLQEARGRLCPFGHRIVYKT